MSGNSKASVILCCYNQKEYVRDAVESVLNQSYAETELVVVDNASTDGTVQVLQEYAGNPRVKLVFHQTNGAVTKRLNEGIALSTGDFISILYSDDFYLPQKIERQMEAFSKLSREYGVVYSPGLRLNVVTGEQWQERSVSLSGDILREMLLYYHRDGFINPISPLVRKECFVRYPFREEQFIEGEGVFFRIGLNYKFQFLSEPLVVMRDHPRNAGKAIKRTKEYEMQAIQSWLKEPGVSPELAAIGRAYLARTLRNYGWQAVRLSRESKWARECFSQALHWDRKQALHPRTLLGTAFSFLPNGFMGMVNTIGNKLRPDPGLGVFEQTIGKLWKIKPHT